MPLGLLILVAVIQGLTEFLPVSSSGHLVLIPLITSYPYQGQTIDVAAHVGTLLAVLLYLRAEVIDIVSSFLGLGLRNPSNVTLGMILILATIPVVVVGYFVNYANLDWLNLVYTLALANLGGAGLLWIADKAPIRHETINSICWKRAAIIGIAQIFALIPGASRSGLTMSAARFLGFDRVVAARFSLLLSIPVISGAGVLKAKDLVEVGDLALGIDALVVVVLSTILALLAIRWMMRFLARSTFDVFVYYRLALAGLLFILLASGQINPTFG
jgi:undecaprenyl-diphosphatase